MRLLRYGEFSYTEEPKNKMKFLKNYLIALLVVFVALGSAATTYAGRGGGGKGKGHGHGPRGASGEVTAISGSTLTVLNRNDESVEVNVSDSTEIYLVASQSTGTLSDIQVGSNIHVRGTKNDDGSVDATKIKVAPAGDRAHGKVTAVDGSTITVEHRRDGTTTTIVTDGNTVFWLNGAAASLSDVVVDQSLAAYGQTQDDGSVLATVVIIRNRSRH